MRELTRVIRGERLALRDRLRANRKRVLEELRTAALAERATARAEWLRRKTAAKEEATSEVARARAELAAARTAQAALRQIDRAHRADAAAHARAARQQSDDDVRALIPRELAAFFDRVKGRIRGSAAQTRAEAFLHYAEKHPEETFKTVEARSAEQLEVTRAELAAATRGGRRDYAERKAARIDRLRARAAKLAAASASAYGQARKTAEIIPLGQPILVGHHSERRHRRDLKRIQGGYEKSFELQKRAETLSRRAESAESNRAISSDDPEAIPQLRAKLEKLRRGQERMRAANKAIRAGGDVVGALARLGFSAAQAAELQKPDFAGRIGFPDYALTNRSAEARRIERRVKELESRAAAAPKPEETIGDGRIAEEDNRVMIVFPRKPADEVRRALKGAGFRWAPSTGAWQRHASNGAWYEARRILTQFSGTEGRLP